ncbi:MAG: RND family efflux transporter MFP subunit [Idiomarina sp. T82-3]|uniref:efflux RND transporter periplasmic adaptor subunit n=1 Tax=Idiomarina TaxID=135575 RepID=UPI00079B63A3|nr:HlyD family efflux transporter periplasmic adaptor subunit [Idiomarina sp. T82-3]KXS33886.1 MAG: RND family efflux transporter MFP subunit [Idiomarina sp. T82-3]
MLTIPSRKSRLQKWLIIAVSCSALALVFWGLSSAVASLSQNTVLNPSQLEVDTGAVKRSVAAYGRLRPRNSSTVIAEVSGTIETIHQYPGEHIEQSELIITLRNPSLMRQLDTAELAVLRAQANLESTEAQLYERRITLENDLALMESEITFAQKELETKAFLLEEAIVAKLDYMRSETSLEQTKLKHQLQQRKLDAFEKSKQAELKAAQYQLKEAEKELEMVRYDIQQLNVTAKRAGILNELGTSLEVGSSIERGQTLAQITEPSHLYADLLISAQDANHVVPSQQVTVNIRDTVVNGEVLRVYPSAENNQVRLEVKFSEALPESARPNLDISAEIATQQLTEVTRLPIFEAVTRNHSTLDVFVLRDNRYVRQQVRFGLMGNQYIEVLIGLKAGDRVLINVPEAYQSATEIPTSELENG